MLLLLSSSSLKLFMVWDFFFCRWLGPKRGLGLAGGFLFLGRFGFSQTVSFVPSSEVHYLLAAVALSVGR